MSPRMKKRSLKIGMAMIGRAERIISEVEEDFYGKGGSDPWSYSRKISLTVFLIGIGKKSCTICIFVGTRMYL